MLECYSEELDREVTGMMEYAKSLVAQKSHKRVSRGSAGNLIRSKF